MQWCLLWLGLLTQFIKYLKTGQETAIYVLTFYLNQYKHHA